MMKTHNGSEGSSSGVVHVTFTHVSLAKASYVAKTEDTGWESIILTQRRTADIGNNIKTTAGIDLEHWTRWYRANMFRSPCKFQETSSGTIKLDYKTIFFACKYKLEGQTVLCKGLSWRPLQ